MKLILCSEGFKTKNAVDTCVELSGKPKEEIKVAIINHGHAVESGDKRWVLDNLNSVASNFPAPIDIIDLLALSIDEIQIRLEAVDVIFVVGGHTDYLMSVFNESGLSGILEELLKDKVYVGSSAGSMILGKRISTEAYNEIYGEGNDYRVSEYLGYVNLAIKPHFGSDNFPNNRAEKLDKYASGNSFPVYGLKDDSAIVVDGDNQYLIGSEPHIVPVKD